MDKESTTPQWQMPKVVTEKKPMHNAAKLEWPQDVLSITHQLRREGCRAIGRMDGKDANLKLVIATLRVLAKHAEAKLVQQNVTRKKHADELIRRAEIKIAQNALQKARIGKALKSQIRGLEARLAAVEGKP